MKCHRHPPPASCPSRKFSRSPALAAAHAVAPVLGAAVEAVHVVEEGDGNILGAVHDFGVPLRTLRGDPLELLTSASVADDVVAVVEADSIPMFSDHPVYETEAYAAVHS